MKAPQIDHARPALDRARVNTRRSHPHKKRLGDSPASIVAALDALEATEPPLLVMPLVIFWLSKRVGFPNPFHFPKGWVLFG